MKAKRIVTYIVGGTGAVAVLLGILLLTASKAVNISAAIVMICLSIAFGLIIPNTISILGLAAGICMLVFPAPIVGVVLITLGIVIAVVNLIVAKKHLKLF